MNKSIFITRTIPENGVALLREKGYRVDVYPYNDVPTQKKLIRYLKKHPYDAVLCLLTDKIDSKVFDAVPTAKLFAAYTVGFDNIDLVEAKKRGITITNTAGTSSIPVAEHAVALMLGLTTKMVEADAFTKKGKYEGWTPMAFIGTDFSEKNIGLIGTGAIGNEVARITHNGFNANILYYDPIQNEHIEKDFKATRCETVEDVLRQADIVSLHVPLLDSTRHIINERTLSLMKRTSFIINTSRGPVIDENALVVALQHKQIAGAGLDVFELEPKIASGLSKLSSVILTPHIASAREKTRNSMSQSAAENIIAFFEGNIPHNIVNK